MFESLFDEVAGLKACIFIKKKLQHRCFSVKSAKNFKSTYFQEHLQTTGSETDGCTGDTRFVEPSYYALVK